MLETIALLEASSLERTVLEGNLAWIGMLCSNTDLGRCGWSVCVQRVLEVLVEEQPEQDKERGI